jgi:glycosyltransferase involved in cell wall biosynthesis
MLVGPELAKTPFGDEAARLGVPVRMVAWSPRQAFWPNLKSVTQTFRQVDARIVHLNMSWLPWMWLVPLAAHLLTSARVMGTMRAMPDPHGLVPRGRYFGVIPGLRLWHIPEVIVGWVWARLLDLTVTINAKDFPVRLARDYGYSPRRMVAIYNGIEVQGTALTGEERRQLRQQASAADDTFLICYAGRISPEKGVHLLIDALSRLPERCRLVIVGDGPQEDELHQRVRALGIETRVHFTGFSNSPTRWMAAADIVAVPSLWYEAFGRVVVEAMREGVPVIASRIGGMAELFEDGSQGRFVESGSVDSLVKVLLDLAGDPQALRRIGEAGRQLVADRYSLDRVERDYMREYLRLAGGAFARSADETS